MKETWKAIVRYEGIYEVSDEGNVRSLKFGKTKILNPRKTTCGYLQVRLCKDGIRKMMLVHRLVAEAFIPNPLNLAQVNHKDENKQNNAASNLEWCSASYNNNYGTRLLRVAEAKSKPVQMFDKQGNLLATFPSMAEAERVTGINHCGIVKCCLGKLKSTGGYVWRYQPG